MLEGRRVGAGEPALVIAEIGVNHDGSVQRALELVHQAKAAGAEAVKLQVFSGRRLMHASARFANYQRGTVAAVDPAEMLRQFELTDGELATIVREIRRLGMLPLATPFSPEDVARVVALGCRAIKLASPDLVNRLLIDRCLAHGLPLLLSTGASDRAEIKRTARWLRSRQATAIYLHCVSSYPTPPDHALIGQISVLARMTNEPVGYSDHTTDPLAGAAAALLNACVIEKHLTHDRAAAGPDHASSADPAEFAVYVAAIRAVERLAGRSVGRAVQKIEQDVRTVSRQSLVTRVALPAWQTVSAADLTCQRPGTGLSAWHADDVVGRRTTRDVAAGEMLMPGDVEGL